MVSGRLTGTVDPVGYSVSDQAVWQDYFDTARLSDRCKLVPNEPPSIEITLSALLLFQADR
jgi:hypothetical protein